MSSSSRRCCCNTGHAMMLPAVRMTFSHSVLSADFAFIKELFVKFFARTQANEFDFDIVFLLPQSLIKVCASSRIRTRPSHLQHQDFAVLADGESLQH